MMDLYKLEGRTPVMVDLCEWIRTLQRPVSIARTVVGDIAISTVFLGLDHNFTGHGPPLLFETMVFGGELDRLQWHYATWDEAEKGHKEAVAQVEAC